MFAFLNFYLFFFSFHLSFVNFHIHTLFFLSLFSFIDYFLRMFKSSQDTISLYEIENRYLPRWWLSSSMQRWCWWNTGKRQRASRTSRSKLQSDHRLRGMHSPRIPLPPLSAILTPLLHPSLQPHSNQDKSVTTRATTHTSTLYKPVFSPLVNNKSERSRVLSITSSPLPKPYFTLRKETLHKSVSAIPHNYQFQKFNNQ